MEQKNAIYPKQRLSEPFIDQMKKIQGILGFIVGIILSAVFGGCHSVDNWNNDYYGNFDALWTIIDEHYCFLEYKDIDWVETGKRYRSLIDPEADEKEFFKVCSAMLDELKDGHTNLISWFDVSYYRKWWSDYPQDFDLRLIQEKYLGFDYLSSGGMIAKLMEEENVGYIYYSSFAAGFGESFLDNAFLSMKDSDGLIIDIRDNGGGDLTNVEKLVGRFINEKILAGYIQHKTGPGHNDFSEPYPFHYEPNLLHVRWLKPIVILSNRSTFSAANNFVSIMKQLPYVTVIGATTGGGSGMPFSSELPNGWSVRFSGSPVFDSEKKLTEYGIAPDYPVTNDDYETDTILETAIKYLNFIASENKQEPQG